MHGQDLHLTCFTIYLLDTIRKINVELRKTLQVQSKSKHQKTLVKVEQDDGEHTDVDDGEDEFTYF